MNEKDLTSELDSGLVDTVKDTQAAEWYEQDALVWALVIKPWVLVQPIKVQPTKVQPTNVSQ